MNTENELMQKLAISKKMMEIHDNLGRGGVRNPTVEEYTPVNATYNLPQEYLSEQPVSSKPTFDPTKPTDTNRIINSNLPDDIKQLMMEHPIVQPNPINNTISNDIIEGAQKLMNKQGMSTNKKEVITETRQSVSYDNKELKTMIRDIVRDTVRDVIREELKDAGMLVESTSNSNEQIQFKVGKHLFIGKVSKVKKLQ